MYPSGLDMVSLTYPLAVFREDIQLNEEGGEGVSHMIGVMSAKEWNVNDLKPNTAE